MPGPSPLPVGAQLADRFEIERSLGRGGFGIVYLAHDSVLNNQATVKELAPSGAIREPSGLLTLDSAPEQGQRLRQSFLQEARLLARLSVPGILPIRAVFAEHGTAYYATDYQPEAHTLEQLLQQEGRMDPAGALDILFQLLETLEAVHAKKILHRDIKPSNVLVSKSGQAYLIDFGSAREWHADQSTRHTVLFTPGYAPIEQLSERGRRGPPTDVYALCATAYRMLTGAIPMPATDRLDGAELTPLSALRPDVEPGICAAIEDGLSLRYHDRPQTMGELRDRLTQAEPSTDENSLAAYDAKLLKLQRFGFERRQCPACGGVLEQPQPLRKWGCPVCRDGLVKKRNIEPRLCPSCQLGTLHRRPNDQPLGFCPLCRFGPLVRKRKSVWSRRHVLECAACRAMFERVDAGITVLAGGDSGTVVEPGVTRTAAAWREASARSETVWMCDGCGAQYDLLEDGRRRQTTPAPKRYRALYPEEWARVAAGLAPGAGNAACDACRADYFIDGRRMTLLNAEADPYGFAEQHLGRLLDAEDARWLGVGKDSAKPGLVCADCATEFDFDGDYLRLVKTPNRTLLRQIGEPKKLIDWCRLALDLPEVHEEGAFRTGVATAIRHAYESGELGFDARNTVIWRGPATREGQSGTLTINAEELSFGGLLRRWRAPCDAIHGARATADSIELVIGGEEEPAIFELGPVELTVHLKSGHHRVVLGPESLARRLNVRKGSAIRLR